MFDIQMFRTVKSDILATGDMGIQEAIYLLYNVEARSKPIEMEHIAEP